MSTLNQAGDGRVQVRDMRTQNALRDANPSEDAVRRLSDRALMAAAQNPDHSEVARAAAAAELRARGANADPWHVTTPSFISAADLAKGDRLFFGWSRALRALAGWLCVAASVALAALWIVRTASPASLGAMSDAFSLLAGIAAGAFGIWLLASLLRLKPARIALLRPAETASTHAPLRRMIARELRQYGHVVSLAAEQRGGAVQSASDYRARASAMGNLIGMNVSALVLTEAMPLSASPGWRPLVFDLLARSCDAVVVDLSEGAQALDEAAQAAALPRCVFVSLWGRVDEAQAALQARGVDAPCFYYAPDGEMQRKSAFRAAMLAAMRAAHSV